ncbi:MAG: hypothetical protein HN474_05195 [Nitrospina sp.]|nr:hypothetical protein [Nitrospina sp.]
MDIVRGETMTKTYLTIAFLITGFLFVVLFFPKTVFAGINIIQCDNPSGSRLDYGQKGLVESTDKFPFGTEYEFKFNSNSPNQVVYTLKRPNSDNFTGKTQVILRNDVQITLIERYPKSVWMYSIFPELGIGYFTIHKDGTIAGEATSTTMTTKCFRLPK